MYNQATQSFDLKKGYTYSSYDAISQQQIQYSVLNPINASDPASQFFTLSLPDCTCYQTGPNNYVVDFVGLFSNTTYYNQDQYNLQVNVFAGNRQIWADWQNTNQNDMQIIVDRPVAVSTILDAQGRPATTQSHVHGKPKQAFHSAKQNLWRLRNLSRFRCSGRFFLLKLWNLE